MNVNTNVYGSYYTGKGLNKNLKLQSDGKKKDVEYVGTKESGKTNNKLSTENEKKLSKKAQDFLKKLKKEYGDYDFFVGNETDDLREIAKGGNKEFSIIFSSDELERMADDEKYAEEKMQGVEGAVQMSRKIMEENGFFSTFDKENSKGGLVNKIGISIDDNGTMKIFAELEKVNENQRKRTWVEANSMEELLSGIQNIDWDNIELAKSGDKFDFSI